ncbi:zinc finger MYM-type protein 1-like [Dendrobium catenatum]|nr:zinc finger MYM-type protein 1-like [Dendrobium catenatum]
MERYFKKKVEGDDQKKLCEETNTQFKQCRVEINFADIPADPGLRKKIFDYHPNERDCVRRHYLLKGPFQPRDHDFPRTQFGDKIRRFNPAWYDDHKAWLEYCITKDAAFCLFCYLYGPQLGEQSNGDSFDSKGFKNWKKKERLQIHVGNKNSSHNIARRKCEDLMNENSDIRFAFERPTEQNRKDYRTRLNASVDCVRFLLQQGLAFRGHDESEDSENKGNFLELLSFLAKHNEDISKVVLDNAPGNNKLISPEIQKEITEASAIEVSNVIINELKNDVFSILLDEARDISVKEQVVVALRYVDLRGCIIEHFIWIVHVGDTTAPTLKLAIEALFAKYGLSVAQLRGQGYDGASNMRGEFNGLKTLIMKENCSAYYVHCFAHQLQLALVAVAKNHVQVASFFNIVTSLLNIIGSSCKRRDMLRGKHYDKIIEQLESGGATTGRGLNQEIAVQRPGDTRWGSHYNSLIILILLFGSILEVLEILIHEGSSSEQRGEAYSLLESMQTFEFIFNLHMMKLILGVTNELSQVLQRKDQDIINAMTLVKVSKQRLQNMRNDGWDNLFKEVGLFCEKNNINVPNMIDTFVMQGRSRRRTESITNKHHYQIELFYTVIDMQLQELNNRFDEINTELLMCVACLNPYQSFSAFDKERLIRLAKFYPLDFSEMDLIILDNQIESFIIDVRSNDAFMNLKGLGELAQKMVETRKNDIFPLVFLLIKLALILPIATATVERAFSAMNIIKNRLRNRMGDSWMNDCLLTYIEKDIFNNVDNDLIVQRFQKMKTRQEEIIDDR